MTRLVIKETTVVGTTVVMAGKVTVDGAYVRKHQQRSSSDLNVMRTNVIVTPEEVIVCGGTVLQSELATISQEI